MAGTTVEDRGQVPAAFAEDARRQQHHDYRRMKSPAFAAPRNGRRSAACCPRLREDASAGQAPMLKPTVFAEFSDNLSNRYLRAASARCPSAESVMRELRAKGIEVALTTGFDHNIVTLLLSSLGWMHDTVDAVVCGDDVANGRPAPDMILLAMKLTGVEGLARSRTSAIRQATWSRQRGPVCAGTSACCRARTRARRSNGRPHAHHSRRWRTGSGLGGSRT